jgi:NADH dehydrogenase/NADH:ubiquinone oxidoreductase subunit G
MSKKTIKEEEVKIPSKKIVVKEKMVESLDENKNIIKTPIQVIIEEKTVEEEIEQKIIKNLVKKPIESKKANVEIEIDNGISDFIREIEAEVMIDDDDIFEEQKKQIIEEPDKIIETIIDVTTTKLEIVEEKIENENIKNEIDVVTEVYHYNSSKKDKLIIDKPSQPLQAEGLFGKKLYDSYIGKKIILFYNGKLLYDSEKSYYSPVFYDNYFELYSIKYSYHGLRIKIKE